MNPQEGLVWMAEHLDFVSATLSFSYGDGQVPVDTSSLRVGEAMDKMVALAVASDRLRVYRSPISFAFCTPSQCMFGWTTKQGANRTKFKVALPHGRPNKLMVRDLCEYGWNGEREMFDLFWCLFERRITRSQQALRQTA